MVIAQLLFKLGSLYNLQLCWFIRLIQVVLAQRPGPIKLIIILRMNFSNPEKIVYRYCVTIHDFSIWLRSGSNPVNINRFLSHTGNFVYYRFILLVKLHLISLGNWYWFLNYLKNIYFFLLPYRIISSKISSFTIKDFYKLITFKYVC